MTDDGRSEQDAAREIRASAVRLLAALRGAGPRVRDDELAALADSVGVRGDQLDRVAEALRDAGLLRWEHRLESRGGQLFLERYAHRTRRIA